MFEGVCWVDVCVIDDKVFVCWGIVINNVVKSMVD